MFLFISGEKCSAQTGFYKNLGAMRASKTVLFLAGILAISNGQPHSFQCSRYCKEEINTFGYETGKVYGYNYEGDVKSLINATKNDVVADESGIKLKCSVDIHVFSACEYAMQISRVFMEEYHVKNTVIEEYPVTGKFQELRAQIEAAPLHFSYHSGKINTICPDGDEPNEILAIKKGILSVFQNSMQDLKKDSLVYETDVTGTCETLYKVLSNENGETVVEKTKNLDACTHRMSQYLSWQSVAYSNSQAKSLPLLRSTLSCLQVYNEGDLLKSSNCEEKHIFQPFSNGENGALSLVKQKMILQSIKESKKNQLKTPSNVKRTSLAYEANIEERTEVDTASVLNIIKELDRKTSDGVEADVPALFSRLVYYFKNLNEENLLKIFYKISQNQKKFYIDAISLLTTTSGIEVMKTLYQSELVSKKQMDSWIMSLSFMKNPNLETIIAVKPLMKMNTTKQNTILAVSSITHRYCIADPNCMSKPAISETIREIELPLENNCISSGISESNDILLALKGIGNAGVTTSLNLLHRCYSNQDSSTELRLAAIAAHRRISCTPNFNLDDFKNYFANPKENTEIRIASYLAMMQCASHAVFAQVKDVLMKEETNQVGSFVWTHITNLQESSVKWKQGLKKLLENEFLRNKFNTDVRKYSRNYEASAFFDSVGAGGSVESNIIFTSESYLPRSAMLNFTLDLFGETINVFEIGARIQGFEDIVENFFGPEGYFSDKSIKTFLENARKEHSKSNEEIQKLRQDFRSQTILKKDPAGLLYTKVFGNEFSYTHFRNLHDFIGDPILTDSAVDIILKLFQESDIEYVKSFVFLDSSYKVPTILGFPLELVANGTSTLGLTVKGKLDLKNLWSYKASLEGKIYPSVSLQIIGTMTVNGLVAKTGVQYVGALNSNTYIDGHALIDGGKLVDLKLNVPKKQMDILSVSSEVLIMHSDNVFNIQNAADNVEDTKSCTQQLFSKITGLQLCHNIWYVNASEIKTAPHFPLTGSFKYALNIKKTDVFDSYQLSVQTQMEEQRYKPLYSMLLYLDTPNSIVDRKIKASYNLNLETLSLKAKLESPFTSFEINSSLGNEMDKYSFQLETSYNNREMVSLQSSFNKNFAGETFSYDSQAKLNYRQKQIAAITGRLNYLKRGQYAANLQLEGITTEPIHIVGDLLHDPKFMSLQTTLSSTGFKGNMKSEISILSNFLMISSDFNYTINSAKDENLKFLTMIKKVRNVPLLEDKLTVKFESSQKPIYNFYLDLLSQRKPWFYKNHGRVTFFETTWETNQMFKFLREKYVTDVDIHADLTCQQKDINYKAAAVYNRTKTHLTTHVLMQLTNEERVEVLVKYKNEHSKENVDLKIYYPKQSWEFNGYLERLDLENYVIAFDGYTRFQGYEKKLVSIAGDYTNSSVDIIQDHKINCTVDFPEMQGRLSTPWIITASLQKSKDMFISFTQFKTKSMLYAGHVNWMKDTLSVSIQSNDKQLFVLNGVVNEEQWMVLLVLNIYQHFELNAKLLLPFERFEMKFYWDKHRDENKKFSLGVTRNRYKGVYRVNMEYPNQQILAAFVLLPTQVTMNVTWGVEVSKRIYLKLGNKVYAVGGLWYGELETPFRYLEKQKFTLKYVMLPTSFEVQSDIAWRRQSINLLMSGSKSSENLTAVFQLNTTLPEISKIGADLMHYRPFDNNFETVAVFIYNDHQINAQSSWKLEGEQIRSDFLVKSPSYTIQPIGGFLGVNTLDRNSLLFEFRWQGKLVNVVCKFKPEASTIVVNTPFEGFENTTLEYNVKSYANSVSVEVTLDLLKQYNNIDLKWSNLNSSMVFFMDITSPVTGYYSLYFTHSTVSGILKESFTIKGHGYKDIVVVKLEGKIISILEVNIATNLQLLEHRAALEITIENEPLMSTIKASWNDFKINTILFLSYESQQISTFIWSVNATNSNIPNDALDNCIIYVKYYHFGNKYVTYVQLPKGYILENNLIMTTNYELVENIFNLVTPDSSANLNYRHTSTDNIFTQHLETTAAGKLLNYSLIFDSFTRNVNIRLDIPYQLSNPNRRLILESTGQFLDYESKLNVTIQKTDEPEIKLTAYSNFNSPVSEISMQVITSDSSLIATGTATFDKQFCRISMVSKTAGPYFNPVLNAELKYNYTQDGFKKIIKVNSLANGENYNFEGKLATGPTFSVHALAKKDSKYAKLEASFNALRGNAMLGYNLGESFKKIRFIYMTKNDNELKSFMSLSSNLEYVPKVRLNTTYSARNNDASIHLIVNEHSLTTNGSYTLKKHNNSKVFSAELLGNCFILYKLGNTEKVNMDMKLRSSIETNKTIGKLALAVDTNLKHFENMELNAEYVENKGYEAWAAYKHNDDLYRVDLNNFVSNDVFEISSRIETPILGLVKFEMNTLKKYTEYTTQIMLNVNEQLYSADVITSYIHNFDTATRFQINMPKERYSGNFEIKFGDRTKLINLTLALPDDVFNRLTFDWTIDASPQITSHLQIGFMKFAPHKLIAQYDFVSLNKTFTITHFVDSKLNYNLHGKINLHELNVRLDDKDKTDFIVIAGKHKFNSFRDFSLSYVLMKEGGKIKIDILNYFGNIYQTKLDISSYIRGWSRITLESKLDQDKIRISFNIKNHRMSLVAKKLSAKGGEILTISFQGETLLEILSAAGQVTLTTSTRFGKYRFFIQYNQNPGIYIFTILKNRENLISLMLQNLSTNTEFDFKGKLIAPELIPSYSNLSLQLHADRDLSRSAHFRIFNSLNELFQIKWFTKRNDSEYTGYFNFNSEMKFLQNIEVYTILNLAEDIVFTTRLTLRDEYYGLLVLPKQNQESKILVKYPCVGYDNCEFFFNVNPKYLNFYWTSPFETWKNMSLVTNLEIESNMLSGELRSKKGDSFFDSKFLINKRYESIDSYLLLSTSADYVLELFEVNGTYAYYKALNFDYGNKFSKGVVKGVFDKDSLQINLVYDNEQICNISFMESGKDEGASFGVVFNNVNIINISRGKVSNRTHSQFLKAYSDFILKFDSFIYYDFSESDHQLIGGYFKRNKTYFMDALVVNASVDYHSQFQLGKAALSYNSEDINDSNELLWFLNLSYPKADLSVNLTRNDQVVEVRLNHDISNSSINSTFRAACGHRKLELEMKGEIKDQQLKGEFNLMTPIPDLKEIRVSTLVRRTSKHYHIKNYLSWPNNYIHLDAWAISTSNSKKLDVQFASSFAAKVAALLEYKKIGKQIDFIFESMAQDKFIKLKSEIVPWIQLNTNLSTTITGFNTYNLTSYINQKEINITAMKNNLAINMNGVFSGNSGSYVLDMDVNYPNGEKDVAKAYLTLKNNNFNMSLKFKNDAVRMDAGFDNNFYNLNIKSPYQFARDVNLKGIYNNNVNIYNLESDGHWNDFVINFSGSLNTFNPEKVVLKLSGNAGENYEGQMNFTCNMKKLHFVEFVAYFPSSEYNTYIKFQQENNEATFILKSPFNAFSSLNVRSLMRKYDKIDMFISGNMLGKQFVTRNTGSMNSTSVSGSLFIEIPEVKNVIEVQLEANKNFGFISLNQNNNSSWNNASIKYTNDLGNFTTKYEMSGRFNAVHDFTMLYKDGPNVEYGIILDDIEIVEKIWAVGKNVSTEFIAKIPYFGVHNAGFYIRKYILSDTFETGIYYNEIYANGLLKFNQPTVETKIDTFIPFLGLLAANSTYINNNDKFEIITTVKAGELIIPMKVVLMKDSNHIIASVGDSFKLALEKGDRLKLFLLLQTATNLNILDMQVSNNLFFLKAVSPSLNQNDIEIILNKFHESQYKQFKFYYKEKAIQKYFVSFTFENIRPDDFNIKADLESEKGKLIAFEAHLSYRDYIESFINLKAFGVEHKGNVSLNLYQPYVGKLDLVSPKLKNNRFTVEIEITSIQSMTFFVSSGDQELGNYVLFQSAYQGKYLAMSMDAPKFNYLKLFKMGLLWDFDGDNISRNNLFIDSDVLGNITIQADFTLLDDLLDIETVLQIPFLENLETFYGKIYIPKEFRPKLVFIFPQERTYSLHFNHSMNTDAIFIDAGFQCTVHVLNLFFNVSLKEPEIETKITIPYGPYNYFALLIKKHKYMVNINKNEVLLSYNYKNDEAHKLFDVLLTTPFKKLEKSTLNLEYKTGSETLMKFTLYHPSLEKEAQFLLTYESLMSFELIYNIHLPIRINDFDFVDVIILNKLNQKPPQKGYILECKAATNKYSASLNLEAVDEVGQKEFIFETEINENKVDVIFELLGSSLTDFSISTKIKSPVELLQNFNFQLVSNTAFSKLTHHNQLTLAYNNDSIIDSHLNLGENWLKLSADNIWRPFSLEYKFTRVSCLDLFAKLIWDLRNPKQSQIGGYLYLGPNISSGLYLPNNTITFDALSRSDNNNETYYIKASWNENDASVLSSMEKDITAECIKIYMNHYIQLPFRKFQFAHNVSQTKLRNINSTMKFIWGEDTASRLTFKNEIHPGKLISTLTTSALEHDLILTIDMSKFKELPSIARAQFEYSSDSDKRIHFEIFYNKIIDTVFATERNFVFKHPASKIDYELYFNSLRTPQFSNGSFVVKYRNFETNTPESIQASVKVDHNKFGVLGEVETSKNSFNVKAASTSTEDSLGFLIRTKVNEKDPLHVECTYFYKQVSPSLNLVASYGDSRRYTLYAGLPNEREITAKLGHELYGKYTLDSLLTMRLNTTQLLWVKILWTKELYPHFYKAILEEYNDLRFVIEATGKELIDVINDDLGKAFMADARQIKQSIIKYAADEQTKIVKDISNSSLSCAESNYICNMLGDSKVIEFIKVLFEPFHEYFKVIRETIEKAAFNMLTSLQHGCKIINVQIEKALKDIKNIKNIKIDAKDILKKGISDARKSLKEMEIIAVKLLDDFDKYVGHINGRIEAFFEPFLNLLDDLVGYVEQRLALLQIVILDVLDKVQHYIYNLRETKEMLRVYAAYINWLEEIHLTDLLEPVGDVIEEILETVITDAKKVTEHYRPYLDALSEAIFGKYDGINQLPPITELREFVNRFYQKTIWIWQYHNMTESLKSFIQRMCHDIDAVLLFIELDEKSGDFENHFGLADYVVKPEVGLIEISQPLTFQWEAFNKPPSFQQHRLYQQIQRKVDQFVKIYKRRYDLIDGMGNLLSDLSEPSIAPITNNFAMIVGRSHFSTFNNNYFNFISNCSYLLASDFHMNSFSLVIKFDAEGLKRSFEIVTSGASIEIMPDYKILFNGQDVELPLLYNHITIMKEYEDVIIESTKGVKMVCNTHYDFCTIQLSGWLFGKTAGLLGTLDNEQNSDIALSNGTKVDNISEFTNSWKLQKQCVTTPSINKNIQHGPPLINGILSSLCNVFFNDSNSPLYKCFDKVDPEPFKTMCFEDIKAGEELTACSVIAAYKTRCKKANVHLDIPELCLRCTNDIGIREQIFDGHNAKSLDVVFITQLNCFNEDTNISLPIKLSNSLVEKGFINNRFASIGFGGKTVTKPHMYTSENYFWTTSEKLNVKYKYDYARWNSQQYKAVDAVKYASNMNFRPGVPKLFILSQCDITTEMENAPEIYNMLGEKDITLHVLKPKPFGNSSYEIGIDGNNNVFSKIQPQKSADEVGIIDRLDDVYSGLALSTNGTIFDFEAVSEDEEVASVWTSYVTKYVKRSPCQKCKCVSDSNGVGRIECSRCLTPAVKQFLNEYEANNKMRFSDFSDDD